jgi:hypothetical protein
MRALLLILVFTALFYSLHAQRIFKGVIPGNGDKVQQSPLHLIAENKPTFANKGLYEISFMLYRQNGVTLFWFSCYSPPNARQEFFIPEGSSIIFYLENGKAVALRSVFCREQDRSPFGNYISAPYYVTKQEANVLGSSPLVRIRILHDRGVLETPIKRRQRSSLMENIQLFRF